MKLPIFNLFKKNKASKTRGHLSNFLLNASAKEKEALFIDVARQANKEQREVFEKLKLDLKVN